MSLLRRSAWQPRPWAGGLSYELASAATWRVSAATIECDGPFTAFPGWFRRTVLLSGAGIRLGDVAVRPDSPEIAYAGDPPPDCRLIKGPVMVLNVFTKPGVSAVVKREAIAGPTTIGSATVALCLHAGLTLDGQALFEFDAVLADRNSFTVSGSGAMLVVSLTF